MLAKKTLQVSLVFSLLTLLSSSQKTLSVDQSLKNSEQTDKIENLLEKLEKCQEQEDKRCQQETLFDLGEAYQISDFAQSIHYYRRSIRIGLTQPNDPYSEWLAGRTLINLSYIYLRQGKYRQSIISSKDALSYAESHKDFEGQSVALMNLGSVYDRTCQYKKAQQNHKKSKEIAENYQYQKQMADVYGNLGNLEQTLNNPHQALTYHQQQLTIIEQILKENPNNVNAKWSQANAWGNIGLAYYSLANYKQAEEYYKKRLELTQKIKDAQGEVKAKSDLGEVHYRYGEFQQAINYHEEYKKWSEDNDDLQGQVNSRLRLAITYNALGQPIRSLELLNEALPIARQIGDCKAEATVLHLQGLMNQRLGLVTQSPEGSSYALEQAEGYLIRSINLSEHNKNEWIQGNVEGSLGTTYLIWGAKTKDPEKYRQAIKSYQNQLEILAKYKKEENDNRQSRGIVLTNMAIAQTYLEEYEKARNNLDESRRLLLEIQDDASYANSLAATAFLLAKQGKKTNSPALISDAIDYYRRSIKRKESIRSNLQVGSYKMTFEDQHIHTYHHLVELLWDQENHEQALYIAEQAKAKVLFDQLASNEKKFGKIDNKLLEKEQILQLEINALRNKLTALRNELNDDEESINDIQSYLAKLKQDYQEVIEQIALQDPETAYLLKPDSDNRLSLEAIQEKLDEETTLVKYFITEDQTIAFIITHNSFSSIELKDANNNTLGRQKINQKLESIKFSSDKDAPPPNQLEELYQLLISPLQKQEYLDNPKLIIVPHGRLHTIPFAALYDDKQYLIDQFRSLTLLPNANLLQFIEVKTTPIDKILILGNPNLNESFQLTPLKYAEREASLVAQLYGQEPILKEKATETLIYQQAKNSNIIHIAAHGKYEHNNPSLSTIYLAKDNLTHDGQLTVQEIYSLDLTQKTQLVILSACETNVGKITRGDEMIGLNRAFIYAGTSSVIATLWTVDDEATAQVMVQFHDNLYKKGMSKGEALIEAQKYIRKDYPNPFYWAAFTLTGDGGQL